jgi:uncharacterized protein (DUF427 family)
MRSATHTSSSKDKEIRIPGPDHPITISPVEGKIRVTVARRIVAESAQAVRQEEDRLEEEGIPARLLLATQRYGHVVARSNQA